MLKQSLINNIKNLKGWRSKRKIVVFSVDDYGNVRVDSGKARERMDKAGIKVLSRFDKYDSLETVEDLDMLYEALDSVKDKNQRPAVFTPFALACNINFEKMLQEGFREYYYELLPFTYEKLASYQPGRYEGAWKLWKEGISKGFMVPQFHGREHLNLKVFKEKLLNKDKELLTVLSNRSYTSISSSPYKTISPMAAFDFWEYGENSDFKKIIEEGLKAFKFVFGSEAVHFNSPAGRENPAIHKFLKSNGIKFIDTPWIKKEHQGRGEFKTKINYTGKRDHLQLTYMVRNVVFEPGDDRGVDWVNFALKQVETAFSWKKPAIISSHRVNFCGHLDEANRKKGIDSLKRLLKKIVEKYPDVEFMSSAELAHIINNRN